MIVMVAHFCLHGCTAVINGPIAGRRPGRSLSFPTCSLAARLPKVHFLSRTLCMANEQVRDQETQMPYVYSKGADGHANLELAAGPDNRRS